MSPARAFTVTRRIFQGLTHEPRTLVLIFLAPVIAMFVFGFAFSGDVKHVRVMVVNLDRGVALPLIGGKLSLAEGILQAVDPEVIDIVPSGSEEDAVREVQAGRASAVVVFPETLSRDVARGLLNPGAQSVSVIRIRLDKTVVNVAQTISRAFLDAAMRAAEKSGRKPPIQLDLDDPVYGAHARFMDFFLPGVMGFACFFLTSILTILSFVGERKLGTLERILVTPLRESEIVCGYALFFGMVGMMQSALLLAIATLVFRVTIVGNLFLAFGIVALLSLVSLSLGILLSSLARTEIQAVQMIPLIVLPIFLLAGIFWPVEAIPTWLRPLSYAIPVYWAVEACRSVMVRGWGIARIWPHALALVGFAVFFLSIATFSLKRIRRA